MDTDRDSGQNLHGSYASYDRDSSLWRTSQISLYEDSTEFSGTLPRSGTMRNGRLYPRQTPELPTSAHDCSSWRWPTPIAADGAKVPSNSLARAARLDVGQGFRADQAGWPEPVEKARARPDPAGPLTGKLNPPWVAWLMGLPIEWLGSEPSGTPSFLRSPRSSGSAPGSSSSEDT